ncbi:GNAT family N-acetyltransferase [Streptomyces kaniharaensis]|uniref:GNAT family N-acetyltransferase n=1 Tax=Streptomyces kaniharaensis TaxID=212423 RepID=A0A6N7KMX1_9ACTN|nr:GNAT family N-acetyltransferase [Streptomyces kaniharaensis]MQS11919.1 GNAT family N-acetyltransferase [Streptomyces kaniharaensis]
MILRPVRDTAADAETVQEISLAASAGPDGPAPAAAPTPVLLARTRHLARTDPQGCWLAESGGEAVGAVLSLRREGLWMPSLFVVRPQAQGKGVGRLLLERAAAHGRGCLRGMVCVSGSPAAARRYRLAGFTLHPAMRLSGRVDRAGLVDPGDIPVHRGNATHRHLLDSVDRRLRGSAHGPDHELMLGHFEELLIADSLAGTGYCYRDGGAVKLLAATTKRIAVRLLREALSRVPEGARARVEFLTAEQEWALDVGLEVGLTPEPRGYVGLHGMRPPAPYLPSGAFL